MVSGCGYLNICASSKHTGGRYRGPWKGVRKDQIKILMGGKREYSVRRLSTVYVLRFHPDGVTSSASQGLSLPPSTIFILALVVVNNNMEGLKNDVLTLLLSDRLLRSRLRINMMFSRASLLGRRPSPSSTSAQTAWQKRKSVGIAVKGGNDSRPVRRFAMTGCLRVSRTA